MWDFFTSQNCNHKHCEWGQPKPTYEKHWRQICEQRLSPHHVHWGTAAQASTSWGFISWTTLGQIHFCKVHWEEQLSFSSRALQLKYQVSMQGSLVFLYLMGFKPISQKKFISGNEHLSFPMLEVPGRWCIFPEVGLWARGWTPFSRALRQHSVSKAE